MPKQTKPLTHTEIKAAKPKDKDYALTDGGGLSLRVRSSGAKQWRYSYNHPVTKKRINLTLGPYPELSLSDARDRRQALSSLKAKGLDPKASIEQEQTAAELALGNTLYEVASQWFEVKKTSVSADYAQDIWRSLELHIFPEEGNRPIAEISAPVIIKHLRPIEAKGSLETVKRITQRLNEIMTFAVNSGLVSANPLAGIGHAFKKPKTKNLAALRPEELPELLTKLQEANIQKQTRYLVLWQLHTMTRPSEAAKAMWAEIDLDAKLWTIPPEKMKKQREHKIPLTKQTLAILEAMKPISGHRDYIFPGTRNPKSHTNTQLVNTVLNRMGLGERTVGHGLRSLASTTLNEQGFDPEIIELALSHVDSNQVRAAYNRAEYLEKRRKLLDWWSLHISDSMVL